MRTFATFGFALGFSLALGACSSESGSTDATSGAGGSHGASGSTTSAASSSTSGSASASTSTSGSGGSAPAAFKVEVYASDATTGAAVNSVLVSGATDAVLVDSQFFKADTDKVIDLVKASGKALKTVLLTHAHPDHYLGLDQLHKAFPDAQVVATKDVIDDFNKSAQGTLDFLKTQYGAQVADNVFAPTALTGDTIDLEGQKLKVISLVEPGESAHAAALGLTNPKALIAGDLLYNNVHLVISECASQGWIKNLTAVKALGYTTFYPGHGAVATAEVFDADAAYLTDAVPIMDKATTQDEAKLQIKAKYPGYQSDFLLGFSVGQYFTNCKKP